MPTTKILKPTFLNTALSLIALIILTILGYSEKCVSCSASSTSWQCGCNPALGIMPWSLYIPLSIIVVLLTYLLPNILKNKK